MEPQKAIARMFFSFASWKVFVVVIFISKLFVYLCFRGRKVFLYFMWWKQSWLLACVFLGVMKGVCCFFVVIFISKLFVCLCFLGQKVFFLYFMWWMLFDCLRFPKVVRLSVFSWAKGVFCILCGVCVFLGVMKGVCCLSQIRRWCFVRAMSPRGFPTFHTHQRIHTLV